MKTLKLNIPKSNAMWCNWPLKTGIGYWPGVAFWIVPIYGPNKGTISIATSSLYSCREDTTSSFIRGRVSGRRDEKVNEWFDKTRLISLQRSTGVYNDENIRRGVVCAAKQINIIEKQFNWPLTKVYSLVNAETHPSLHFFYFEGTKRWNKAPAMLSLYMLLIRMCKSIRSDKAAAELKRKKTLSGIIKFWSKEKGERDIHRFKCISDKLENLFNNYQLLFGERSLKELYSPVVKKGDDYLSNEGIEKLVAGRTIDERLSTDWAKVNK